VNQALRTVLKFPGHPKNVNGNFMFLMRVTNCLFVSYDGMLLITLTLPEAFKMQPNKQEIQYGW